MPKSAKIVTLIIGLLIISGVIGALIHQKSSSGVLGESRINQREVVVNLTSDGFDPKDITISQGTTVKFTTTAGKPFWPASDLHPTHTIYPEFDPKEPIEPSSSWSFKFEKVGKWKFHDHLDPYYTGSITVTDYTNQTDAAVKRCSQDSSKQKCWEELIDTTLSSQGLDSAFSVMDSLYQSEPQFASDCHGYAHKLGNAAYKLFAAKSEFNVSPKASYCGYGFYHGFMEALLHDGKDIAAAQQFCSDVGKKLSSVSSDAEGACYHGIGHGSVDDVPDPKLWGKPEAIVDPALALCEEVADEEPNPPRYGKLFRCVTGVFNAYEIVSDAKRYGLSPDYQKPFSICLNQPGKYKEACFTQMVIADLNVSGGDFKKAAEFVGAIPEDDYAVPSLAALAIERLHKDMSDIDSNVTYCRGLVIRFQIPCIQALGEGFMKYGSPNKEYLEALNFCASNILNSSEREGCYSRVLPILRIWYSAERSSEICQSVDKKYQVNNCQYI